MNDLLPYTDNIIALAVSLVRVAGAFLIVPAFSPETIPALVRNSIFVALGLVAAVLDPGLATLAPSAGMWIALFAKEALIGIAIGLFFSAILWAFEAAGQIIDTKVGLGMASIVDPLSGHQSSVTGQFLARLANFLFMAAGGFMLLVGTLMESYAIWPIGVLIPDFNTLTLSLFEGELQRLMTVALLVAAPVLTVLLATDLALGLVNRYAQQLNVFSLSMSLKGMLATLVLIIMLGTLVDVLLDDIAAQSDRAKAVIEAMTGAR
ncbi:MAG: type III secretion system export apparatus subunit SctT [Pseudomonadota bacterium]